VIETIAKSAMLGLFAAAAPVEATEPTLWAQWGLAGLVVAYVLWRDWQREKRMSAAIDGQQRWIRDTLVAALERNAAAMERMVTWLEASDDPRRARTHRLRAVAPGDASGGDDDRA
jgi:hypothetical protein